MKTDSYKTQSPDTSREIEKDLFARWRKMPAWEKAREMDELSKMTFELAMTGLRNRNPQASQEQLRRLLGEMLYGKELMDRAFGER